MVKQRVIAYVDGFNLFYSSLKGTKFKWLDLVSLCKSMLNPDSQELVEVNYFSAYISSLGGDINRVNRQQLYIDALRSISNVNVHLGFFSIRRAKMPKADDFFDKGKINTVEVAKTEEKGTDVNLAVKLVADAFRNRFDYAMLFSNDSDMSYAVHIATNDCMKKVGLYIDRKAVSFKALRKNICYTKRITPALLASHQLPEEIKTSKDRIIKRPREWI